MGKFLDITGTRYNKLVVLGRVENVGIQPAWKCQCDCGNIKVVIAAHLKNGTTKSCGCIVGKYCLDLIGRQFGQLTVLNRKQENPPTWLCKCSCATTVEVSSDRLLKNSIRSCGCLRAKAKDFSGVKFNKVTALEKFKKRTLVYWKVICDCGVQTNISQQTLIKNKNVSCGCSNLHKLDLNGQTFTRLTVVAQLPTDRQGSQWLCRCICGVEKVISGSKLKSGAVKSCGCLKQSESIIGDRFGNLTIVAKSTQLNLKVPRWDCVCDCGRELTATKVILLKAEDNQLGCSSCTLVGTRFKNLVVVSKVQKLVKRPTWNCLCNCGAFREVAEYLLLNNTITSCGCDKAYIRKGLSTTKEYRTWIRMLKRCYDPDTEGYKYYGGREDNPIQVCNSWADKITGFDDFLKDMGAAPSSKHSIERLDVNADYSASNCCWILNKLQQRNKRNTRLTPEAVLLIRSLTSQKYYSYSYIFGEVLKVCPTATYNTVRSVCIGKSWVD